jgi:hypothetical protein
VKNKGANELASETTEKSKLFGIEFRCITSTLFGEKQSEGELSSEDIA